jgi:hypothetical protein
MNTIAIALQFTSSVASDLNKKLQLIKQFDCSMQFILIYGYSVKANKYYPKVYRGIN